MSRTAVIAGIGAAVPRRVVTNAELARHLDTSDEWIRTRTGIHQRHVVGPGTSTGVLATEAGQRALKSAGESSVDLVVLATTTPDRPCPATAPIVASRLGLTGVAAYDLSAVCSGFLYALRSGTAAIAAGFAQRVLVIGAESFTTLLDPDDRTTVSIFGDGAGAVVLRAGESGESGALLAFDAGSDGGLADLITVRAGGAEERAGGEPAAEADRWFRMEGRSVFVNAVRRMTESSRAVLAGTGWAVQEIDRFVGHQANSRILQAVAEQLGVDDSRVVTNIARVGNTAAASIPLALADAAAAGQLQAGHRVLLTAFGGGATWASAALTWPELTLT
jgi:3-oxoacyl-[acyl-carrier-protein] synthase-3